MPDDQHSTEAFGLNGDTICFNGEIQRLVGPFNSDNTLVLVFSDGTVLYFQKGSDPGGTIWTIDVEMKGRLFIAIDHRSVFQGSCSDIAYFRSGLVDITVCVVHETVRLAILHQRK